MISPTQFKQLFPNAKDVDVWVFAINTLCPRHKISPIELAQLLAQCGHESGGFTRFTENLMYSREGLLKTFPKYFNTSNVTPYIRNPQKIANRTYANRMGNSNEASGDGWKYRGRGPIQATGKNNYRAFSLWYFKDERAVENPDLLLDPMVGIAFVCWFWKTNKLSVPALKEDTVAVTKRINGGAHGLQNRLDCYKDAKKVLCLA